MLSFQPPPSDPGKIASVMKDDNQITGTVPTEIGLMTSLTRLSLGKSSIWIETFEAE